LHVTENNNSIIIVIVIIIIIIIIINLLNLVHVYYRAESTGRWQIIEAAYYTNTDNNGQ